MKNKVIKEALEVIESLEVNTKSTINSTLEDAFVSFRKETESTLSFSATVALGKLVYTLLDWSWVSSEDIEKGSWKYIVGATHYDLALTYIEDLFSSTTLENALSIYIKTITNEKSKTNSGENP